MAGYGECWTWQRNGTTPGIDKVLYLLERVSPFFGDALHFGVMCTADNYHRRIYALRFRVWMLPGASLRQPTCWWGYIQGSYVTSVQHILGKGSKARKIAATKSWLVLVLHPIGWESDASFLNQSQSEVKQNQWNPALFIKLIENFSIEYQLRMTTNFSLGGTKSVILRR